MPLGRMAMFSYHCDPVCDKGLEATVFQGISELWCCQSKRWSLGVAPVVHVATSGPFSQPPSQLLTLAMGLLHVLKGLPLLFPLRECNTSQCNTSQQLDLTGALFFGAITVSDSSVK